ncbi:MAG: hypothetical protein GXO92_00725 [FCB group bacterium]|nr:hypothetical protein [FCB group bacterium]
MTSSALKSRIYQAQCFGNVEPIEHMVPYPNLAAVPEGQTIKFKDRILYAAPGITNGDFWKQIQQTAAWLKQLGIHPEDRVLSYNLPFPQAEILAFGIWTLGASLVLVGDEDIDAAAKATQPKKIISRAEYSYPDCIAQYPDTFVANARPLLQDEALIYWDKGRGIRLSHYNLLVNANGVQQGLDLEEGQSLRVALPPSSVAWVVLQVVLPSYAGLTLTTGTADLTIGLPGQFTRSDYIVDFSWQTIQTEDPPHLFILPEAGGVLAINKTPIHLMSFKQARGQVAIRGHSVMMGYLNDDENEIAFTEGQLHIRRGKPAEKPT